MEFYSAGGSAGQACFMWADLACSSDGTLDKWSHCSFVNLQSQSVHPQTGGFPATVQKL